MSRWLVPPARSPVAPASGPPSFTVVVAAHQAQDTVAAAVLSALRQTLPPHEVVVCDDGSTDRTPDVLAALAAEHPRLVVLTQPNAGASAARNAAVARATGDLVVVLDADDVWDPRRLEELAALAVARPDLDVLTTDAWFVVDGVRRPRTFYDDVVFPVHDQRRALLESNPVLGHAAVRRHRWREVGGADPALAVGEDWDLWLRLVLSGSLVGCVREPLVEYRLRADSLSGDRVTSLKSRVTVLQRAAARADLLPDERPVLEASLRRHALRAERAALERALAEGDGARGAARSLLAVPAVPVPTRLRAAAVLVA
ncbi:MAG: glycosyl transferase group 1, partial [Frankiales bacterium]|nr:glycosyl transferase group 1 [Frankiales bacterium]